MKIDELQTEKLNEGPIIQGLKSMIGGKGFNRGYQQGVGAADAARQAKRYINFWHQSIDNPAAGTPAPTPDDLTNFSKKFFPYAFSAEYGASNVMPNATTIDVRNPDAYILKATQYDLRNHMMGPAAGSQIDKSQIIQWIADRAAAGDTKSLQSLQAVLASL